ncbi:hypothetical protein AB0395_25905 [Streptosporangium sp. NPDC051023]|uniref:hypothetical protein n=1 Tax=Streptosporangium sp. NPDC051023 TaxID=3155410 RepID=UPI00344C3812
MATQRKPRKGILLAGVGVVAGALGVAFVMVGLEQADRLASVLGAFVGLAGLAVSVYGLRASETPAVPDPAAQPRKAVTMGGTSPPPPDLAMPPGPTMLPDPAMPPGLAIRSGSPPGTPAGSPVAEPPASRPAPARRYGGDHVEFQNNVFHGPVTGKNTAPTDPADPGGT